MSQPEILWSPSERAIEEAQVTQFARQMVRKHHLELNTYADFHRWTVENPQVFWNEVWDFCGVIASRKGSAVLVDGDKMPGARWFPEARFNLAQNLLRRGDRERHAQGLQVHAAAAAEDRLVTSSREQDDSKHRTKQQWIRRQVKAAVREAAVIDREEGASRSLAAYLVGKFVGPHRGVLVSGILGGLNLVISAYAANPGGALAFAVISILRTLATFQIADIARPHPGDLVQQPA